MGWVGIAGEGRRREIATDEAEGRCSRGRGFSIFTIDIASVLPVLGVVLLGLEGNCGSAIGGFPGELALAVGNASEGCRGKAISFAQLLILGFVGYRRSLLASPILIDSSQLIVGWEREFWVDRRVADAGLKKCCCAASSACSYLPHCR